MKHSRYDTNGLLVCTYVKSDSGRWTLHLEPGFILVESPSGFAIWDTVNHKLVEFAK